MEDSFKSCSSLAAARHVLRVLAPDLLARVAEDAHVRSLNPGQAVRCVLASTQHAGCGSVMAMSQPPCVSMGSSSSVCRVLIIPRCPKTPHSAIQQGNMRYRSQL